MKKLFIVRHTTKQKETQNEYDYDTELTKEGIEKATQMAQKLALENHQIDLIVASPAVRTRHTAEIFASELGYNKTIMLNEVLYMAFVNELIETITYTYDTVDTMLLVGHNPSLTAPSSNFSLNPKSVTAKAVKDGLWPTSNIVSTVS